MIKIFILATKRNFFFFVGFSLKGFKPKYTSNSTQSHIHIQPKSCPHSEDKIYNKKTRVKNIRFGLHDHHVSHHVEKTNLESKEDVGGITGETAGPMTQTHFFD